MTLIIRNSYDKYLFNVCFCEYPIYKNGSFNVKIYIGLLSDLSKVNKHLKCTPMVRT